MGHVTFTLGQVERINGQGHKDVLKKDASIEVGDQITTNAAGHAHIRFIDQGFISVRPNSRLLINAYRYDRNTPKSNEVKFTLYQGVVRSISGQAAQGAKDKYRLNTPTAAIGIRGTDFVVSVSADITRVSVESGSIVMAPLNSSCSADTLGPCQGSLSRVLTSAMRNAYLELRSREFAPILIAPERGMDAPNKIAPPRPEEPKASADKTVALNAPVSGGDAVTEALTVKVNASLQVFRPELWWGRWSNASSYGLPDDQRVVSYLAPGRELGAGSNFYGLVRKTWKTDLPNSGAVSFRLFDGEALLLQDKKANSLLIQNASLMVNFETRRFDTQLNLVSPVGTVSPIPINASGTMTFDGYLFSAPNADNTSISGFLANSKNQAAYIFERALNNGTQVYGVTRWQR